MKFFFKLVLLILVSFSLQSCLVSRCERPQITGYIYDAETKRSIENCKVGETFTQSNGYFSLKEKRYRQFTFFGFEAPTLAVNEAIEKENYQSKSIKFMQPFGGGMKKGAFHNADTIYIKKTILKTN
ncbi:hypothetical protein [Flavobacterium nitrogenifigens]|uniref:CarboxypepD_reg-like domain-containing protein n=1 Tax=Flavobacterium nitrogenifigens TaxID=1617283 RepID=A0A521BNB2_9FLAO|nr:hypothetical protein [Flavobacterium nitrogenifigens]KAF2330837.1 hypothetical protein DM397_13665 [Flavobacterium nitrogenifigens]SMO48579.1 hypothetical protein SAMN06265220_1011153 [Flavobacterium nitrogenifigens]